MAYFLALLLFTAAADRKTTACEVIESACESAGFQRTSGHDFESKDLDRFCYQPTLRLESVPGVHVTPETVNQCLESIPKMGKTKKNAGRRR